ncbi:hypothetical protein MKY30_15330 [Oceanobacillus sp. FSL W8-0428]|uniref:hypothetical protein n=1 Tax=unclassified Oceanobacillus TaxID=2630292 RepID=UPI0030DA89D2
MNKKKIDYSNLIANLLLAGLVIVSAAVIVAIPIMIIYGLSNILAGWNLIEIRFFDNIFINILYFGGLLFLSYLVGIIFNLLYQFILKLAKMKETKKVMFLSYMVQLLCSVIFYKSFIEPLFTRINISWEGTAILFFCLYLSAFVISEDYKIFSDKKS